jgi:hypothetical protein
MKKTIGLLALLVLFGGAEAIAQSGIKNSPSIGQTIGGGIPQAPVGHRQPRASDVPNEKNLMNANDAMTKENAALNKKLKSICRGC